MDLLLTGNPPSYAVVEKSDFPIWAGAPRQYRFDGQLGVFVHGAVESSVLSIQPIDYRWWVEERWGRPSQAWLDVAFVDADGCVSQISLKKDSAIDLFELFINLKSVSGKEVALAAIRCTLKASERVVGLQDGTESKFFVLDLKSCNYVAKADFEVVRQFTEKGLFQWLLVGEVA